MTHRQRTMSQPRAALPPTAHPTTRSPLRRARDPAPPRHSPRRRHPTSGVLVSCGASVTAAERIPLRRPATTALGRRCTCARAWPRASSRPCCPSQPVTTALLRWAASAYPWLCSAPLASTAPPCWAASRVRCWRPTRPCTTARAAGSSKTRSPRASPSTACLIRCAALTRMGAAVTVPAGSAGGAAWAVVARGAGARHARLRQDVPGLRRRLRRRAGEHAVANRCAVVLGRAGRHADTGAL